MARSAHVLISIVDPVIVESVAMEKISQHLIPNLGVHVGECLENYMDMYNAKGLSMCCAIDLHIAAYWKCMLNQNLGLDSGLRT